MTVGAVAGAGPVVQGNGTAEEAAETPLRQKLIGLLAVALTPIFIIALLQAAAHSAQAAEQRRAALLNLSAIPAASLAANLSVAADYLDLSQERIQAGGCEGALRRLQRLNGAVVTVAALGPGGCTSGIERDRLAGAFAELPESRRIKLAVLQGDSPATDRVGVAVGASGGRMASAALIDSSALGLGPSSRRATPIQDARVGIADASGMVIGLEGVRSIPGDWRAIADGSDPRLLGLTVDGDPFEAAVSPLPGTELFEVVIAEAPSPLSLFLGTPASVLGVALATFIITLIAVWYASEAYVIRWLERLRNKAERMRRGHYHGDDIFENAPAEVKAVSSALLEMGQAVAARDASLVSALEARDAALAEVHHRVKNSLQVVTSFLSIQARSIDDEEALSALKAASHRINALALVHKMLYRTERLDVVALAPLIQSVAGYLADASELSSADAIALELCEVQRSADDAVPVSIFVVEAASELVALMGANAVYSDGPVLSIRLQAGDGALCLKIENLLPIDASNDLPGIGRSLMNAFARQLGGTVDIADHTGRRVYSLSIPHSAESEGPAPSNAPFAMRAAAPA